VKQRIAIIGAGLCGSVLSAVLSDQFEVTVIEKGRKARPLFHDLECGEGEVASSINRAEGLGGTTNYWHNALMEMDDADLAKAGIPAGGLAPYYDQAWAFFLSEGDRRDCDRLRQINRRAIDPGACALGHMVVRRARANAWTLANARYPGARIRIIYGNARVIVTAHGNGPGQVVVDTGDRIVRIDADYIIVCAGGLATPVLLAQSTGHAAAFCGGYHDHPMAYVAKLRLRPGSRLGSVSSASTRRTEVRGALVYESAGIKTAVFLRPALNMKLQSIHGPVRFILSDLRNDPFSPRKILALLTNLEALREGLLFRTRLRIPGDFYSVLVLGEQQPLDTRGLAVEPGKRPILNWHVTEAERQSYRLSVSRFLGEFADEIVDSNVIPADAWEFRTAAHHSGASRRFVADPGTLSLEFFAIQGVDRSFVCDGSLLRAGGIANSGLTLVALSYRLAELISATA
jgi:hypothetical protein